jgi:hypothetical protein
VARDNLSDAPLWNSHADSDRPDDVSEDFVNIDITDFIYLLTSGTNVLAVQALNDSVSDETFFVEPQLSAAGSLGVRQYFQQATPGAFNVSGAVDIVSDTKFSVNRGFYDTPFDVRITTDTADATIHYTLDGSTPTETEGLTYAGPIAITGTTCLRAMAFKPGWLSTNVDTQTYIFPDQVIRQPANPPGFAASWGSTPADYAMDQRIVDDLRYSGLMRDSLLSIPTMSIVTDLDNLFGPAGIYENPLMEGAAWERPVSIEWINSDGTTGFQVNAGLRAYGGAFRRMDLTRKKSLRILFKRQYGPGELDFPFFDAEDAATRFDTLILRAGANDGWNNWGDADTQYIVDEFMRRTQLALGQRAVHGRFVHLYVNGLYWGLYNPVERADPAFAATYYGGDEAQWDAINAGDPVGESTATTWNSMLSQIRAGMGSIEAYQKIQGNNPDGTDNPAYDDLLDVDNYVDYLFSNFWGGTGDWGGRNWYVACLRPPYATGFKFFNWDSEGAIIIWSNLNANVTGATGAIQEPYQALRQNEEFRMSFADHAQRHLFNGGPGTSESAHARYKALADKVELAIIAESARWGDQATGTPYTLADWQVKRDYILNTYMPQRPAIVMAQLRTAGLYPSINPPAFQVNGVNQHGGYASAGDALSMVGVSTGVTVTVVQSQSTWKYLDNGSNQGTAWRARTFADSGWLSGPAELGYGDNDSQGRPTERTVVKDGAGLGPYGGRYVTTYFRHHFNVADPSIYMRLILNVQRDDGAVVYLNGVELGRPNMPGTVGDSSIDYVTSALSALGGTEETTFASVGLSESAVDLLVPGDNVLAAEVHQFHPVGQQVTSSDISFDLELKANMLSTNPLDNVYYTIDGSDPRLPGGAVSGTAVAYNTQSPIVLAASTRVKARTYTGGTWSALNEVTFAVGPVRENLRITEIMYHSADPNAEFIELRNIGAVSINLNLVRFTAGIDFTFGDIELAPNEYVLVVGNQAGFMQHYPGFAGTIAGEYEGNLSNTDDKICLRDAVDTIIHEFTYKDGWYDITDGEGFSLTIRDPHNADPALWGIKEGWRPSGVFGGTPGYDDAGLIPDPGAVVINEVLAHSHAGEPDWIELHNTTDLPINIGGWFLSDDNISEPNLVKYEIAAGTSIPAYGYKVFYQDETFGNPSDLGSRIQFALSEGGDSVYLRSGSDGVPSGYEASESFGASASGVTLGRHIKSALDSGENFVAMSTDTPWTANAYPMVGPVIITEIMYNPDAANTGDEFIELHNITGAPVLLADETSTETGPGVFTTDTVEWMFSDGITFTFPAATVIPANGYLIIAKDPAAFTNYYGEMPAGVDVIPMGDSSLGNGGERLQIVRPGDQEYGKERFWIRSERVTYGDGAPWPTGADGEGMSLSQKTPDTAGANYGNDAANWQATMPNPGQ